MKNNILVCLMSLAVFGGAALSARAQNFAIDWFTLAGGGGASAGGVYSVSGTVGQPEAGIHSGGNYSLSGGFWSIVPPSGPPPLLHIVRSGSEVVISWPAPATGFELEQNADLSPANWTAVGTPPTTVGSEKQVLVSAPAGNRFFRLMKKP
jgi:hypothetical protein